MYLIQLGRVVIGHIAAFHNTLEGGHGRPG
jgi:hypothetical protein